MLPIRNGHTCSNWECIALTTRLYIYYKLPLFPLSHGYVFETFWELIWHHSVDRRNLTPVDRQFIPLFTRVLYVSGGCLGFLSSINSMTPLSSDVCHASKSCCFMEWSNPTGGWLELGNHQLAISKRPGFPYILDREKHIIFRDLLRKLSFQ